ncbi:MAG TPA: SDR family oxidoreductase [Puia sp.]|nr:SDR family oxidoreductase [Puia sp.]
MENKKQFAGLWAVILGGSSGFGLASLIKLAQHGMNIAVAYREMASQEKELIKTLLEIANVNGVTILPCNINALDEQGRNLFIQKLGEATGTKKCIRILLHSIARGSLKPLVSDETGAGNLSLEDIQLTSYAMSNSLLDWARILLQRDFFCEDARIIGLTSEGSGKYWENYAAVSIAKASLQSLATYMAVEFAKYGLKTNLIQAGITRTPALKKMSRNENLAEFATKRNPSGRLTLPSDVANVIYLLCTDEAAWINGAVIHVDGGEHCC